MPSSDLMRPFFIVGTERSGSNLLRLVLNAHSRLHVPHPPHIMALMSRLEASYGDLVQDACFRDLVEDACRLTRLHTNPWDDVILPAEVMARTRGRSLFAVYAAIHELAAVQRGKA